MKNYQIPAQIEIRPVRLTVRDLDRAIDFYTRIIGLRFLDGDDFNVNLGVGNYSLVQLIENPRAQRAHGTTGLYHFAILVPHRKILAKTLKRIIETQTRVQGFADHGVSEAIYLPDPDGNGIEIYRDRPRQEWLYQNGELQMITDPLNINDLLSELNGDHNETSELPEGTTIGHMHLHVRDIPEAITFYRDVLGFELKQHLGSSAAFLAAGDYHHHIGVNTWAGVGAPAPPDGAIGLRSFTITLSKSDELKTLEKNIHLAGIKILPNDGGFGVQDPSGNHIHFSFA